MIDVLPARDWALVVHGGASGVLKEERHDEVIAGIEKAFRAGEAVLEVGGSALDAVCAAVCVLEDEPVFNAGRGAALTAAGTAEHDACVMTDDATAGAVAASKYARNPVLAARAVMEQTKHVLIVDPPAELLVHAKGAGPGRQAENRCGVVQHVLRHRVGAQLRHLLVVREDDDLHPATLALRTDGDRRGPARIGGPPRPVSPAGRPSR